MRIVIYLLTEWLAQLSYTRDARDVSIKTDWMDENGEKTNRRAGSNGARQRPRVFYIPALGRHFFT